MKVGVMFARVRMEEKMIFEAFDQRGIDYDRIDVRDVRFDLQAMEKWHSYDVILDRCISFSQALSAVQILESEGIPCVNSVQVSQICGDKQQTTSALVAAGVPTPRVVIAYTPEAALDAIEEMGYPVVLKPAVGSWGRLLAKVESRSAAEAIIEHKVTLGSYQHSIFYIQEYIDKPDRDIRTIVINDETVSAITRNSEHWITNTARGGTAETYPLSEEADEISRAAARAMGGGILAVDLLETPDGRLLVNEVNHTMEFRGSISATGINIPAKIVKYVLQVGEMGLKGKGTACAQSGQQQGKGAAHLMAQTLFTTPVFQASPAAV